MRWASGCLGIRPVLMLMREISWFRGEMDIIPPSEGGGAGSIPAGTAKLSWAKRPLLVMTCLGGIFHLAL